MSTLTVQPSAPIVAPLLADWLLDLLPPGRPRRISTMLPRRLDADQNLSNTTLHAPARPGTRRRTLSHALAPWARSDQPRAQRPAALSASSLWAADISPAEYVTWRSSARHRIWRVPEPRRVRR